MRNRIYLIGSQDCLDFCNAANERGERVDLVDGTGRYRINAKSIMGCLMASREWGDEVYIESEADLYDYFHEWIADTADDAANIHE